MGLDLQIVVQKCIYMYKVGLLIVDVIVKVVTYMKPEFLQP